jgi:hypothetical protein
MRRNRQINSKKAIGDRDLCRGPGRLYQALSLGVEQNAANRVEGSLQIVTAQAFARSKALHTTYWHLKNRQHTMTILHFGEAIRFRAQKASGTLYTRGGQKAPLFWLKAGRMLE